MSYELLSDQSVDENLRRIFQQQIDAALTLARGEREPADTLVHDIRKHLKKARAILQLIGRQIGRTEFRHQNGRLRKIGRLITEIRDAEVRLQTIRQLEHTAPDHHSYKKMERLLESELEEFILAFGDWKQAAIRLLQHAREDAVSWPLRAYDYRQLRRALQRSYRSGKRALTNVQRNPSAAKFHQLRKRVKLLGYQVRLLEPWNHVAVGEVSRQLHSLGHLLGRVHDLTFLGDRLRFERDTNGWDLSNERLFALVAGSEAELQRDGLELGGRFFAERPSKFGAHVDEWFKDSQQLTPTSVAQALVAA